MSLVLRAGAHLARWAFVGWLGSASVGCGPTRDWGDGAGGTAPTTTDPNSAASSGSATSSSTSTTASPSCSSPSDCGTGFCVDGVCCDSACDGPCVACVERLTGAPDGACAAALSATDPHNDCAADTSTCGQNGECDGSGACAFQSKDEICEPASCTDGVRSDAKTCDGAGSCVDGGSDLCAVGCNDAGSGCADDCTPNSCGAGKRCDEVTGKCVDETPEGVSCTSASQCASGNCVDGVCCDSACEGVCHTCATGKCEPAAVGSDPRDECAAQAASTCGTTGACNGAGACAKYAGGTVCAAAFCSGNTATNAKTCDGAGGCKGNGSVACTNGCSGSSCAASCTSASCDAGEYCASSGACAAKKGNGGSCSAANQCSSGNCVDGVCCNSACTGGCQQCSTGTCGNVPSGQDPKNACATQAASTCGTTGSCDGAGSCAKYPAGTQCAAATCSALTTLTPARHCTDSGACGPVTDVSCGNYACIAGVCNTSCTSELDCAPGFICGPLGKCRLPFLGACDPPCVSGYSCCNGVCKKSTEICYEM